MLERRTGKGLSGGDLPFYQKIIVAGVGGGLGSILGNIEAFLDIFLLCF